MNNTDNIDLSVTDASNKVGLDIIGDIHGHASALENLLAKMGYAKRDGVWRHPGRLAIFVGDYVDRGNENIRACRIVMDMHQAHVARAIMGNHEFNHLALDTEDPYRPGKFLRPRTKENLHQAATTLAEFEKSPDDKRDILEWMKTLPLWLDLPKLRVVHACWNTDAQEWVKRHLDDDNYSIDWSGFPLRSLVRKKGIDSEVGKARSRLLSGPEYSRLDGMSFTDSDGLTRKEVRLKWWKFDQLPLSLRELAHVPAAALDEIPHKMLSKSNLRGTPPDTDPRPVIFGHYCMKPKPDALFLGPRHVCVDASVAKGGKLAAYRFSGESELTPDNLVFS